MSEIMGGEPGQRRDFKVPVETTSSIGTAIEGGKIFTAGALFSITTGSTLDACFENPAGSGKFMTILSFSAFTDAVGDAVRISFVEDPTITGGTAVTPLNHNFALATAASGVVTMGQAIASGGSTVEARIMIERRAPFSFSGAPFILPPGKSICLKALVPVSLTTSDVAVNITWRED